MRIAVIGVGLIGGSIGLATGSHARAEVVGWDADPRALQDALERDAIEHAAPNLAAAVEGADFAFVAVPGGVLSDTIAAVLRAASPDCVVTDVGSTKRSIVSAHTDERFVGGHPLAGAETSGIAQAHEELFEDATWYLTPTPNTSGLLYERLYHLLGALGARPVAIDADTHDAVLALVSHLPHVLANVLVSQAAGALSERDQRLPAIGPSFRDATRVAGASSTIWTDIYMSNRDALIAQIDATVERLNEIRSTLSAGDAEGVTGWNERAAEDRRRLLESQLAGGELAELRVAVPNEPGVVAKLALELGRAGINITDLALYPAPDMSEGVVALWIPGAGIGDRAQQIIEALDYPVFRP